MKKKLLLIVACLLTCFSMTAIVKVQGIPRPDIKHAPAALKGGDASFSFDDIKNWTGTGDKKAAFVLQWNFDYEYVTETNALVFGYRYDDDNLSAIDMIVDIVKNNPRLYMAYQANGAYGASINGIGYDANDDGYFFVYGPNEETVEFDEYGLYTGNLGGDDLSEVDPTDYWRSGWFSGYWSLFDGDGANNLNYSSTGASGIVLNDGTWVGFNFCTDMSSWTPPDWKPFISAPSNSTDPDSPFAYIENWTGKGSNCAAVTIQFNDDREENAMTFGYRFDGETTGAEMLKAIVENNPRLYALMPRTYTAGLYGLGWDANDNQYFGLDLNGTEQTFVNHIVYDSNNSDNMTSIDTGDLWQTGWMMNGFWAYFIKDNADDDYEMSMVGYGERTVKNGSWDAWYFDEDYSTFSDGAEWKPVASAPVQQWRPIDLSDINSLTLTDTANEEVYGIGTTDSEITFTDSERTNADISNFLQAGNSASATFNWRNRTVEIAPMPATSGDALVLIVDNSDSRFAAGNSYAVNGEEMAALQSATIFANVRTRFINAGADSPTTETVANVKAEIVSSNIAILNAMPNGDGSYNVSVADGQDKCTLTMKYKDSSAVESVSKGKNTSEIVETVYFNSLGQRADRPFSGLNIIVNRHADGRLSTLKRIFR